MEIIIRGRFKEGKTTVALFFSKLLILAGAEIQFEDQEEMEINSILEKNSK